jgi:hypothetical protein
MSKVCLNCCKEIDGFDMYDMSGNVSCYKCWENKRNEFLKIEEREKANRFLRLFRGIKNDKNMLCMVIAEIATILKIDVEKYVGKEEQIICG